MRKITIRTVAAACLLAGYSLFAQTNINTAKPDAPWKSWVNNPLYITVAVQATNVFASSNTDYVVTLADATIQDHGIDCSTVTNSVVEGAKLRLNHDYLLTVIGTNVETLNVSMTIDPGLALVNTRALSAIFPKEYTLLVNGDSDPDRVGPHYNSCGYYSNSWRIQVITAKAPQSLNRSTATFNDSDFPNSAPGDGVWARIGPGKSSLTNHCAMDWSVSMGHLADGCSAGRLYFKEEMLSSNTYTPASLYYASKSSNVQAQLTLVSSDTNLTILRQISAPQTFVDIVPTNYQYDVRFYTPDLVGPETNEFGIYTNITGAPFVTWKIQNPDHTNTVANRLNIIEDRSSYALTNRIQFDSTNRVWSLQQGAGGEQRLETRTITFTSATNRNEVVEIKYSGGSAEYQGVEYYQKVLGDWQLVQAVEDPSGANLTTLFDYYQNDTIYTDGQIKSIIYPDGSWEKRLYDDYYFPGSMAHIYQPWLDSPFGSGEGESKVTGYARLPYSDQGATPYGVFTGVGVEPISGFYGGGSHVIKGQFNLIVGDPVVAHEVDSIQGTWSQDATHSDGTIGDYTSQYSEDMGPYAGHFIYQSTAGMNSADFLYYDIGTYDSTSHSFDADGTGPDWKMNVFHGISTAWELGDFITNCEDHANLGNDLSVSPMTFVANESTRETTMMHGGATAQKETYIYTGLDGDGAPMFTLLEQYFYTSDSLGHTTNIVRHDPVSGVNRTTYSADWKGGNAYDTDLKYSETDENGIKVSYGYDVLKRLVTVTTNGLAASGGFAAQTNLTVSTEYNARGQSLSRILAGGSLSLTNFWSYDLSSRLTNSVDTNGLATAISYANGGLTVTTTHPGGATEIVDHYLDGQLKSRTGTAVVSEYHSYDTVEADVSTGFYGGEVRQYDGVHYGATNSTRWATNGLDWMGRVIQTIKPDFVLGDHFFTNNCQYDRLSLAGAGTNGLPANYYVYDYLGRLASSGQSMGSYFSDDLLVTNGLDRFKKMTYGYVNSGGTWYYGTTNQTFLTDNDGTPTTTVLLQQINNLASGVKSVTVSNDIFGNATTETVAIDRSTKKVTDVTVMANSTLAATNVTVNGLLQSQNTPSVASPTLYVYDDLKRVVRVQDPLGFSTSRSFDPATGQLTSTTNAAGQGTQYEYYTSSSTNAGRLKDQTDPNVKKTYYDYNARGQQIRCWGDVPYPEERVYNDYGEMTELHTYRGGSSWTGSTWPSSPGTADVTHWNYQAETGLLTNKTDAAGHGVSYTYVNNMLQTRTWARGVMLTNIYSSYGDLLEMDYSDGTPSVIYTNYNRAGLPRTIVDATGTHTLAYDIANRLVSDTDANGIVITNHFDSVYGRDKVAVTGLSATVETDYSYDAFDRMHTVSSGSLTSTYGYLANSDLVSGITNKNGSTNILITTKGYEYGYRLTNIANLVNGTNVSSHEYAYDSVDRRTSATREDGSHWDYGYNDRNEVVSGKKKWSDNTLVAGQQFEYNFDNIGNRTKSAAGGDAWGAHLRVSTYRANNLNQYTNRTVPGGIDVIGCATNAATVTVNNSPTSRKDTYFRGEPSFDNSTNAVYSAVLTLGVVNRTTNDLLQAVTNYVLLPKTPEAMTYDEDGNLLSDGLWNYTWDGENRLVQMTNTASVPSAARKKLLFGYDNLNRRNTKTVYTWATTNWNGSPVTDLAFFYDGFNLLTETTGTNVARSYCWGLDLSGNIFQAGGVGGIVTMTFKGSSTTNCFPGYDGNGNIFALINAVGAGTSAQYEYSPFGELIRSSGVLTSNNPFRFSTKFWDAETSLIYYGWRYYSPSTGKWLGRDPTTDQIFLNLYQFCKNNGINRFDIDGQSDFCDVMAASAIQGAGFGMVGNVSAAIFKQLITGQSQNLIKAALQGAAVGAITGCSGAVLKGIANGLGAATGVNNEFGIGVSSVLSGFNAAIGFMTKSELFGDGIKKTLSSGQGQAGFAFAIAIGAFVGAGSSYMQENDLWEGYSLDVSLKIAGSVGGAAATSVWAESQAAYENLQNYFPNRLNDQ